MSAGLKALLDAAQYIEHQENLKRSPQAIPTDVQSRYIEQCTTTFDINVTHGPHSNNNVNTRNSRNTAVAVQQVSSSAPAASATFQHITNGVIIANNSGTSAIAQHRRYHNSVGQDLEFKNENVGVAVVPSKDSPKLSPSTSILSLQGNISSLVANRVGEDCISKDEISSISTTSPKANSFAVSNLQEQSQQPSHEQLASQIHNNNKINNNHHTKSKSFRFVDSGKSDIAVTAVANKQMLLNGGLRVASPAATIGIAPSKAINIPNQQQQAQAVSSIFSLISSTSAPHIIPRYKSSDPLTPPPVPCRKVDETEGRIRSFSLSSHKIPASQLQLHNGDSNDMIVEDGRPVQCLGSDHSPLRQNVTSSQYFQMLSSQHISGGSQSVHLTPIISTTGRRRTISSNSNGAGTREVHNKLEKNRRAHLKECYEQLKNELPLKDDERKKTSNLAILGEALKYVKNLKKKDQELEAEVEQLAKTKINSQRKLVSLKRELGFPVPLPDFDLSSSEREHTNETGSLSSGRGSILYSSSSSLSSGGSSGSTTMSSPVSASIQTAMPTAISPVISRINSTNVVATNFNGNNGSLTVIAAKTPTSKSPIVLETLQEQIKSSTSTQANSSSIGTLLTTTPIASGNSSIANVNSNHLSLTTNNISVMSLTRESPTPSTPSPSPSGSSCVSSSSSIISTSPPRSMNGVINGRNVTVSIPNNLRFTSSSGIGANVTATTNVGTTINNGVPTAAATINITPQLNSGNVTNTNNAKMLQALRGCHLV